MNSEALHLTLQYAVAILCVLLELTGAGVHQPAVVSMTPHPETGFDHLASRANHCVFRTASGPVEIRVDSQGVHTVFRTIARDRMEGIEITDWAPLREDGSLGHSIGLLLPDILEHGECKIDSFAGYAGHGRRSLQRGLAGDGEMFSDIAASVRRDMLERLIVESNRSLGNIAQTLGFSGQSTLTRAARRWTGELPGQGRKDDARTWIFQGAGESAMIVRSDRGQGP